MQQGVCLKLEGGDVFKDILMNFRTSDPRTGIIGAKEPPYLVLTRGVKFVHKPMKYSKFLLQTTALLL